MFFHNKQKKILIYLFLFFLITTVMLQLNFSLNNKVFNNFSKNWDDFWHPISYWKEKKSNIWLFSLKTLWNTMLIIVPGTGIGFGLAIISTFCCYALRHKFFFQLIQIFLTLLRLLPIFIFFNLFTEHFPKTLATMFIYVWFGWLWCHKYLYNNLKTINYAPYKFWCLQRKNKFIGCKNFLWKQMKEKLLIQFLYSIEVNLKWSVVLSSLGIYGFGQLINDPLKKNGPYNLLLPPLLCFCIMILFFEIFIIFFKSKYIKTKKYTLKLLIIFLVIQFIYSFSVIDFSGNFKDSTKYLSSLFQNNWWSWFQIQSNENQWFMFLEILLSAGQVLIIGLFFGTIFGFLSCSLIVNKYFAIFINFISFLFRIIPMLMFFYIFKSIFVCIKMTAIFTLGIMGSFHWAKQIQISLANNRNNRSLLLKKKQNYLTFFFVKFLWSQNRQIFKEQLYFWTENIVRDLLILGTLGANSFGDKLNKLFETKTYTNIFPFTIPMIIFFIFLEYFESLCSVKK